MSEAIGKFIGDNLFGLVAAGISAVALYYVKSMVKALAASKKKHPLSTKDMDIYGQIIGDITIAMIKTNAARCYILSIRNGDVQISNLHQYKLYCDYEVTLESIKGMKCDLQAIPVQDVYAYVSTYYCKNGKMNGLEHMKKCDTYIYDYSTIDVGVVKQMMVMAGTDITVHSVIRNTSNEILGVLCLDYCSEKDAEYFKFNKVILLEILCEARDKLQSIIRKSANEN